jgi:hypothetical protein
MKTKLRRVLVAGLCGAFVASSTSCYTYYQPPAYTQVPVGDSKGEYTPEESAPPPAPGYYAPRFVVDPGLVVAGIAAAGMLGYALGNNHSGGCHYGPPSYYGGGYAYGGYH